MPKIYTSPTLYDEAMQIYISKLKEWGYLVPGQQKSGTITWSRNGHKRGWISINVNMEKFTPYLQLDYNYGKEPRSYKVPLVCIPSNLGKGKVWYFRCPATEKRCRKLYSIGGYFLHREAFNGCMYDTQTQSKKYRQLSKTYGKVFECERLYEELHQKYFKTHYAGKPTKRYLQILEKIQQAESISIYEMEKALYRI